VRKVAVAISATLLLWFIAFPLSFAQQTTSNLFLGISPNTIDLGDTVFVRVSVILKANPTTDMVVRFIPPQGTEQEHPLHFEADSLGFASQIVEYPNDIATGSTQQPGNYTVLVQDKLTGVLLERGSFEVAASKESVNFIAGIPREVLFPVVVAGIGAFFTYWYSLLSAKRETKVALNQKKSEAFLALRPHYAHVQRSTSGVAELANDLRGKDDSNDDIRKEYRWCFYHLILYVRERNVITDKFGAYFLSDPRGEGLLVAVEKNIIDRLRKVYNTPEGFDELGQILSQQQTLPDLEIELGINYKANDLYEIFKEWIKNNNPENQINEFIRDLKLYSNIINYERTKMFEDWYREKEGVKRNLIKSKNTLISELKKDPRYCKFNLEYFIDK
jgi:hypothetical protein